MSHWSQFTDPIYQKNSYKWRYAQRMYTGDYLEDAYITEHLPQKPQRETDQAYTERKKTIDPQLDYSTGLDSLVGTMFNAESQLDRQWSSENQTGGLGDPNEPSDPAYYITRDADGSGTDWNLLMKRAGIKFGMYQRLWGLVEGIPRDEEGNQMGEATLKLIDPQNIVNRYYYKGKLTDVLLREYRDTREKIQDDPTPREMFTHYSLDGWRRFYLVEDEDGDLVERTDDEGSYEYYRTTDRRDKILPIFETVIPLPRNPGYIWARKANAILNHESVIDHAFRNISFAILKLVSENENFQQMLQNLKMGGGVVNQDPEASGDHEFISPDSGHLSDALQRSKDKKKDFFYNMFKDYGDAAKEKSATQIRLESQSGIEAYLTLLVSAIDEFENAAMWRLSQIYAIDQPSIWGNAYVKRRADFQPKDIDKEINDRISRYFGSNAVPADVETLTEVAVNILELDGYEVDDERRGEIRQRIQNKVSQQAAEEDQMRNAGLL